jgi:hypothetical protein
MAPMSNVVDEVINMPRRVLNKMAFLNLDTLVQSASKPQNVQQLDNFEKDGK